MHKSYTGGCACGAIRYEISGEPMMAGHCQCRDCQRETGGGHASFIAFADASAMQLTGAPRFHDVKADSGNTNSRGFCANCGSPVISKNSGFADLVAINAGSLDDPNMFEPQFVIYTASGRRWDHIDPKLRAFAGMPPSQTEA